MLESGEVRSTFGEVAVIFLLAAAAYHRWRGFEVGSDGGHERDAEILEDITNLQLHDASKVGELIYSCMIYM